MGNGNAIGDFGRRRFLRAGGASTAMMALAAAGLLQPVRVLATEWQRSAFTANTFPAALKAYAAAASTESREIVFSAPDIAENGAQVVVEISSNLPGSQSIAVFAEKNPMPLAATLQFANGALPQVRIPLKLAETTRVRAVVKTADGRIWHAQREIRVTLGGCAG
ncbi:MAG: thiosulfate oxidation carrier protein SoxY [Rhodocyclales bacterium]|nr:thiosulfate oxidation carrier protein SoxY [Rhodocyclales bacterium]